MIQMRLYTLWSQLFYLLLLFSKGTFSRRPIWNIAHMVNDLSLVDYYLNEGANGLEFDIYFENNGAATFTFHGVPCDCFRSCTRYEDFTTYLNYLRRLTTPGDRLFRKQLVLLYLDLKVSKLSTTALAAAGEDVARKLLDYYWRRGNSGGQAHILLSLPSVQHGIFVQRFYWMLEFLSFPSYKFLIGFGFSGNEDLNLIRRHVKRLGIYNFWQGDGITNCLLRGTGRLLQAIDRRDNINDMYISKVYWWNVDKMSSMRKVLRLKVDALITNYPRSLVDVLNEDEFSGVVRLATTYDRPWTAY